jgi:hypothetical protein
MSLTIFAAPKPGDLVPGSSSHRALQSWLALHPPARVVLFGLKDDPSLQAAVAAGDGRVSLETAFDTNFLGVPMFNSLITRSMAADSDVSLFVNADIILLDDVCPAMDRTRRDGAGWVVTGMRTDVDTFPFEFPSGGGSGGSGDHPVHDAAGDGGDAAKLRQTLAGQFLGNALTGCRPKCSGLVNGFLCLHTGLSHIKHCGRFHIFFWGHLDAVPHTKQFA